MLIKWGTKWPQIKKFEYKDVRTHQNINLIHRIFCIWESVSKHKLQSFESYIHFMELYVRLVDLELHFPNNLSNAKMSYVSNVDLDKWTNLGMNDFSSWDPIGFRKLVCSCENFKIQLSGSNFVKWKLDHYITNVYLDEFYMYSWLLYSRQFRVQSKCLFFKNLIFDLVKLGQMTH